MARRKVTQKKGSDIKSFILFMVVCGLVVLIATAPWIMAIAGAGLIVLFILNPKFKVWVMAKLGLKKKEKK
jgi:hypothetical protein